MSFYDEVKSVMKSKEQVQTEQANMELKKEQIGLMNTANVIYESIKHDILSKSSRGEHINGRISGNVPIFFWKLGYYNGDMDLPDGYFISAKYNETSDKHNGLFRFHTVHTINVEIEDLAKVLKVHALLNDMCKNDGISIGAFYLHARIFEYPFQNKLIREDLFQIKKNRLRGSVVYHTYSSKGNTTGENGSIDLAVNYEYQV